MEQRKLSIKLFELSPTSSEEAWTELEKVNNRIREIREQIAYINHELWVDKILRDTLCETTLMKSYEFS